ncbi:hypothetical protein [Streptomyces sp. NPDC093598]|uniref:hypothetical protein n=1 Tax=Streptomyces sp. NPDC093598 TaxID=3366046 RepID=UPI0038075E99
MSTEAQRASFPPRPTAPPRPPHPPAAPEDPARDERNTPGKASDPAPGPEATTPGTDGVKPTGRSAGRPRFPGLGATPPQRVEPASPPPPRASTRFPDKPPSVGRETRPDSAAPAAPPRPRHLPTPGSSGPAGRPDTVDGTSPETSGRPFRLSGPGRPDASAGTPSETTGRPFRLPAPRRTGTPGETSSETTARLRPVPADPAADEPAGPFARPATQGATAARPGSVRPGTPPRPAPEPPATTGTDADTDTGSGTGRGIRLPSAPTRPPVLSAPAPRTPAPVSPDPALSWSATRPLVSFGEPEGYDGDARPRPLGGRGASQAAAAAACLVLGLGLISGAVTGSWLVGGSGEDGAPSTFAAAGSLWHSVPVDQLFPPMVQGQGAGPGGADRTWTRIAVAPDSGCKDAFDPLLRKALAPVGCERLLRATYTDATESYVTTVGLLFTTADASGMTALANRFRNERLDRRSDLMPLPYAAKGTPAADFGAGQRASWTVSVLTEAPVVVYAVSGWADGRSVDDPQPAEDAMEAGATTAAAQAGLGNEAQGLADRVERDFRRNVRSASEQPS